MTPNATRRGHRGRPIWQAQTGQKGFAIRDRAWGVKFIATDSFVPNATHVAPSRSAGAMRAPVAAWRACSRLTLGGGGFHTHR